MPANAGGSPELNSPSLETEATLPENVQAPADVSPNPPHCGQSLKVLRERDGAAGEKPPGNIGYGQLTAQAQAEGVCALLPIGRGKRKGKNLQRAALEIVISCNWSKETLISGWEAYQRKTETNNWCHFFANGTNIFTRKVSLRENNIFNILLTKSFIGFIMITKYKLNVVSVNCYIYSKKEEFLMKNGFKKILSVRRHPRKGKCFASFSCSGIRLSDALLRELGSPNFVVPYINESTNIFAVKAEKRKIAGSFRIPYTKSGNSLQVPARMLLSKLSSMEGWSLFQNSYCVDGTVNKAKGIAYFDMNACTKKRKKTYRNLGNTLPVSKSINNEDDDSAKEAAV